MTTAMEPASSAAPMPSPSLDDRYRDAARAETIAAVVDIGTWCIRVPATLASCALAFAAFATAQPLLLLYAAGCAGLALIAYAPVVVTRARAQRAVSRLEGR